MTTAQRQAEEIMNKCPEWYAERFCGCATLPTSETKGHDLRSIELVV